MATRPGDLPVYDRRVFRPSRAGAIACHARAIIRADGTHRDSRNPASRASGPEASRGHRSVTHVIERLRPGPRVQFFKLHVAGRDAEAGYSRFRRRYPEARV